MRSTERFMISQWEKDALSAWWNNVVNVMGVVSFCGCVLAVIVACSASSYSPPMTGHFTKQEFNQRPPLPLSSFSVDHNLIAHLETLRSLCNNRPIIITSGYRTQEHNAKVGGARHSQHLLGKAADIRVQGVDNRMLANYARIAGFSFIKVYADHVHVDVR